MDEAVVGLPLDLSGEETDWTAEVRAFGDDLARRTGLPVHWMDERLTSVAAERAVRGMGLKQRRARAEGAHRRRRGRAHPRRLACAGATREAQG